MSSSGCILLRLWGSYASGANNSKEFGLPPMFVILSMLFLSPQINLTIPPCVFHLVLWKHRIIKERCSHMFHTDMSCSCFGAFVKEKKISASQGRGDIDGKDFHMHYISLKYNDICMWKFHAYDYNMSIRYYICLNE